MRFQFKKSCILIVPVYIGIHCLMLRYADRMTAATGDSWPRNTEVEYPRKLQNADSFITRDEEDTGHSGGPSSSIAYTSRHNSTADLLAWNNNGYLHGKSAGSDLDIAMTERERPLGTRASGGNAGEMTRGLSGRDNKTIYSTTSGTPPNSTGRDYANQDKAGHYEDNINPHSARYRFNCTNIKEIKIKYKIGHGVSKQVYLGQLVDGDEVGVKMVTRNVQDVVSCVKKLDKSKMSPELFDASKAQCNTLPNMKLMKEILLLEQIRHPNLLKMVGYCVRSEETDSTSLQDHGVVAVYEYGQRFYVDSLRSWTLRERLQTALQLADLLDYLENSPLGPVRLSDFKEEHFLLRDNKVKLTDLDDVTSLEPSCTTPKLLNAPQRLNTVSAHIQINKISFNAASPFQQTSGICHYGITCWTGICPGHNAKYNLDHMNRIFFRTLLTVEGNFDTDAAVINKLLSMQYDLDRLKISAAGLKTKIADLLKIHKSL